MKKAYIFPGIGYHCDKPLLYYTKKLLKDYEIIEIQFKNLDFDIQVSEEKAFQQAKEQMKEVDSSTLFVSKSIGTYCAARLAKEYKIQKNIYFTPLEDTMPYLKKEDLIFSGSKDQWANYDVLKKYTDSHGLFLHTVKDGNHSLETGNIIEDIENMKKIMIKVKQFIEER